MENNPMLNSQNQPQYNSQIINQPVMTYEQFKLEEERKQKYAEYLRQQSTFQPKQEPQPPQQLPYQMNPTSGVQGMPIQASQTFMYKQDPAPFMQLQQQSYVQPNVIVPDGGTANIVIQKPARALPQNAEGCAYPSSIKCGFCNTEVRTVIRREIGCQTVCMSVLICFCMPPFFFVPCCVDECQDRVHNCPNCQQKVGEKKFAIC